jgi:hypothetical protein
MWLVVPATILSTVQKFNKWYLFRDYFDHGYFLESLALLLVVFIYPIYCHNEEGLCFICYGLATLMMTVVVASIIANPPEWPDDDVTFNDFDPDDNGGGSPIDWEKFYTDLDLWTKDKQLLRV